MGKIEACGSYDAVRGSTSCRHQLTSPGAKWVKMWPKMSQIGKKRRICSIGGHQRLFVCYKSLFFFKLSLLSMLVLSAVSSDHQVAPRPQKLPKLAQKCQK